MEPEESTEELRELAEEREAVERDLAEASADEEEAAQHKRRAEKTRYLKEKLEERENSEKDVEQ